MYTCNWLVTVKYLLLAFGFGEVCYCQNIIFLTYFKQSITDSFNKKFFCVDLEIIDCVILSL